jgi:hypothetical protein
MRLQWPQTWIERISPRSDSERVTLRFKDYSLSIVAIRDENTGTYSPLVQIIWTAGDEKQNIRSLTLPDQCFSAEEARFLALREGKAWADRWLARENL